MLVLSNGPKRVLQSGQKDKVPVSSNKECYILSKSLQSTNYFLDSIFNTRRAPESPRQNSLLVSLSFRQVSYLCDVISMMFQTKRLRPACVSTQFISAISKVISSAPLCLGPHYNSYNIHKPMERW